MSDANKGMTSKNDEMAQELRLLEAVDHGIVATDTKGSVTYWNRFSEQLTGIPPSAALGNSILDLVSFSPIDQQSFQQQIRLGGTWQGDCQFKPFKVGLSPTLVRLVLSVLRDSSGAHSGFALAFCSLSNRTEAIQKIAIALAHEINQPLGAISNFVGGLIFGMEKSASTDTELSDTLKLIYAEAIRASEIVSRMRKPASLERINDELFNTDSTIKRQTE